MDAQLTDEEIVEAAVGLIQLEGMPTAVRQLQVDRLVDFHKSVADAQLRKALWWTHGWLFQMEEAMATVFYHKLCREGVEYWRGPIDRAGKME